MRHPTIVCAVVIVVLAGCETSIHCGAFVYSPEEGRCTCPAGFIENEDFTNCVPIDGGAVDDAGAGSTDAALDPDAGDSPCTEGETMPCGTSDVGECALGTQRCTAGAWTACAGAVEPSTETCNDVDDDCDGTTDEDLRTTFYRDADGDEHGTDGESVVACTAPTGFVVVGGDCNDANATVHPAQEAYFAAPIPGATLGARYDYDCSGTEDPQYPNTAMCSGAPGACSGGTPGFLLVIGTPAPACGEGRDNFVTGCTASCMTNYATRVQACR